MSVAPMLFGPVVRKVDGGQIYITGNERQEDGLMVPKGWLLTALPG